MNWQNLGSMRVNLLSDKNKAAMEGISLESTQVLMGLIEDKAAMEKLLLERRFRECARDFEEVLKFMKEMQALTERGREIRRAKSLGGMQKALRKGKRTFSEYIMKLIMDSPTRYGKEMRGVLKTFGIEGGKASLGFGNLKREYYAARNMFLEAEAIRIDRQTATYTINSWFYPEFIRSLYAHGTTPEKLDNLVNKQAAIGLAAELKVFEHEREVVGCRDAAKVIHIAKENTNAGFDIASARREEETDQLLIRMIEVKAVSPKNWAFTLTKNEILVAAENKDTYFLYLVPVIKGEPEVTKMDIIQNPVKELLDEEEWTIRDGDWNVSRVARHG